MVNPGHPSFACGTCKQRRIRCDAQRPTCQRCEKSKRVCLGYDSSATAAISCKKQSRRRGPSKKPRNQQCQSPDVEASNSGSSVTAVSAADLVSFIDSSVLQEGPFDFDQSDWRSHLSKLGIQSGVNADESELKVLLSALEVIGTGLSLLRQPSQTLSNRRRRLLQYGKVTSALRVAISSRSSGPTLKLCVLLFSFYEMINGTDPYHPTWRAHLDGLLAMIDGEFSSQVAPSPLGQALAVVRDEASSSSSLNSLARAEDKVTQLLLVCTLQLRQMVTDKCTLFRPSESSRKLDVQKLRIEVKKVHRNLGLIPKLMGLEETSMTHYVQQQHFQILQIITAKLLLKCGEQLHDDGTYRSSNEYKTLKRSISSAIDGIHEAAASVINPIPAESEHIPILPALSIMWPLYEASRDPDAQPHYKEAFTDALWNTGQMGGIPKAMDLSRGEHVNMESESTILDGVLLASALFSPMFFVPNT